MKDFLGQELRIGDNVVIADGSSTGRLMQGKIVALTTKFVVYDIYFNGIKSPSWQSRKSPNKLIKIDTILNNM